MTASDSPVQGEEHLLRGFAGRMSLLFAVGGFAINLGRQGIPPLLPTIVEDLDISSTEAGFALTVLTAGWALSQYPSGRLSDGLSRVTILVGGLAVAVVGFVLLLVGGTYPLFVFGAALIGVGGGSYYLSMRVSLSDLFVDKRGRALGFNVSAVQLGNMAAGGLAVAVLSVATWRTMFAPVILLLLLSMLALHTWRRDPYVFSGVDLDLRETLKRILGTSRLRWLLVAYTLTIFTWLGIVGFLPTFLQVDKGMTPTFAGLAFGLLFFVGLVVQPFAGDISDRIPRPIVASGGLLVGVVGLGALALGTSRVTIIASIVFLAAGIMAVFPVMQAFLLDIFPDSSVGGDFGAFRTSYQITASLGPTYVGVTAARTSYTTAFVGLTVCLLASAVVFIGVSSR